MEIFEDTEAMNFVSFAFAVNFPNVVNSPNSMNCCDFWQMLLNLCHTFTVEILALHAMIDGVKLQKLTMG